MSEEEGHDCEECGRLYALPDGDKFALLMNKIDEFRAFADFLQVDAWDERAALLLALNDSTDSAIEAGISKKALKEFDDDSTDRMEEAKMAAKQGLKPKHREPNNGT